MSKYEELEEIRQEMSDLLQRARDILRGETHIWERARAYWFGHLDRYINGGLGHEIDMETTVRELYCKYHDEEDEDEGDNDTFTH